LGEKRKAAVGFEAVRLLNLGASRMQTSSSEAVKNSRAVDFGWCNAGRGTPWRAATGIISHLLSMDALLLKAPCAPTTFEACGNDVQMIELAIILVPERF
jgi:hypothetical protein